MKKLIIISVLSAAFVSPAVFAQAKNFEGFGIQLSTGYQNNEIKPSNLSFDGVQADQFGFSLQNVSKGEMPLNLGASYTFALTEKFTLGALVEYNPLSMNSGSSSVLVNGIASNDPLDQYSGKLQNQVSLSLVPGYAFSDTTMGYARIGWINATAVVDTTGGDKFSKNTNGLLLGLGAKHMFNKNIFGFAEATYATYGGGTSGFVNYGETFEAKLTPSSYSFLVGVGVLF
jgi:opacity protein-like surface antigen